MPKGGGGGGGGGKGGGGGGGKGGGGHSGGAGNAGTGGYAPAPAGVSNVAVGKGGVGNVAVGKGGMGNVAAGMARGTSNAPAAKPAAMPGGGAFVPMDSGAAARIQAANAKAGNGLLPSARAGGCRAQRARGGR
jgi:hypothetical protein